MGSRAILVLVLIALGFAAGQVFQLERRTTALKTDAAEIAGIQHGMLNVDRWKEIVSEAIAARLNELDLSANRETLKPQIVEILESIVDQLESVIRDRYEAQGKPGESGSWRVIRNSIRGFVLDMTVDFDDIRHRSPEFADTILDFLEKPENQEQLKEWIRAQMEKFAAETAGTVDNTAREEVLGRYGFESIPACLAHIEGERAALRQVELPYFLLMGAAGLALVLALVMPGGRNRGSAALLLAICAVLLATSLFIPMIDIDARITEFRFDLLGRDVRFENQLLFFQSKSLFDVIAILLRDGDPALAGVAFLILAFSVLFPLTKIALSAVYLSRERSRGNPLVSFFVFRSGKWSMADVMVIAIFMAYIGFNGIIGSQLGQLERLSSANLVTTNGSALQPGFYLFTAFCVLGLATSQFIQGLRLGGTADNRKGTADGR